MTTTTAQIPSHLRFLMAGIQDRAIDLALLGHTGVKAELDIGDTYAVFELITRPAHGDGQRPEGRRITAQLSCVLGISAYQSLDEAVTDARAEMAAMLDHLDALIAQESAQ